MSQLPIETKRLILRTPELSDAPAYAAILTNPKNIEFDPEHDAPKEANAKGYEAQIAQAREGYEKGEKALCAVCLKNEDGSCGPVIGMGGFPWLPANANGRPGNTGALIDAEYARKGYGSEALVATLDFGFDVLGFENIEQDTEEINVPYRALMSAMGFEPFGQRQEPDKDGQVRWLYTVNKQQWAEIKAKLPAR